MNTDQKDDLRRDIYLYRLYMKSDIQLVDLEEYDIVNGNVWDHLAQISAFIMVYFNNKSVWQSDFISLFILCDFEKLYRELIIKSNDRFEKKTKRQSINYTFMLKECDEFKRGLDKVMNRVG